MTSLVQSDELDASLSAYSEGDLLDAVRQYPRDRLPTTPEGKLYRAGLFLITGQVVKAERLLAELDGDVPNRLAMASLIAAVTQKESQGDELPKTASEWLAQSYYLQSKDHLVGALQAAERATALAPEFGFGCSRVAELEFGRDRAAQAKKTLKKALTLAPRNPAAHAVRGSILSAEGKLGEAQDSFEKAMALDSALGDAWAGRGLIRIRQGQLKEGQRDLFTAAALEPNRVLFRKYLEEALRPADRSSPARKNRTSRAPKTESSKPSSSGNVRRPDKSQTPEPIYPGRIAPSVIGINPNVNYPRRTPRPRPTATPGRAETDKTPWPEKTRDRKKKRGARESPPPK